MRGRTNIPPRTNITINADIERFTVASGSPAIAAGDFVSYSMVKQNANVSGTGMPMAGRCVFKLTNDKFLVNLRDGLIRIVSFVNGVYNLLNSVAGLQCSLLSDGNVVITSVGYIKIYSIGNDEFNELSSTSESYITDFNFGISQLDDSKIVAFRGPGGSSNAVLVYDYSNGLISNRSSTISYSYSFGYCVYIRRIDDSTVFAVGSDGKEEYPSYTTGVNNFTCNLVQITGNSSSRVTYLSNLNYEKKNNQPYGKSVSTFFGNNKTDAFPVIPSSNSSTLFSDSYYSKIKVYKSNSSGSSLIGEIQMSQFNPSGTNACCSVSFIDETKMFVAFSSNVVPSEPGYGSVNLKFAIIDTEDGLNSVSNVVDYTLQNVNFTSVAVSYSYTQMVMGIGTAFMVGENIYYIWDGVGPQDTYSGKFLTRFTYKNGILAIGSPSVNVVEKYSPTSIGQIGFAKTAGSAGQGIEVYIPPAT